MLNDMFGCGQSSVQTSDERCLSSGCVLDFRENTHLDIGESQSCCGTDRYSAMLLHAGGASLTSVSKHQFLSVTTHLHKTQGWSLSPLLRTTLSLSSKHHIIYDIYHPYIYAFWKPALLPKCLLSFPLAYPSHTKPV